MCTTCSNTGLLIPHTVGHRSVLVKHIEDCIKLIDLTSLMPHLSQHRLLTRNEQERLNNRQLCKDETSRANALVEIILRKGDVGLQCFLDALQEEQEHMGHVELYQKLTFNQPSKYISSYHKVHA